MVEGLSPAISRMRRAFVAWNRLEHAADRAWVASKAFAGMNPDERATLLHRLADEHDRTIIRRNPDA